MVTLQPLMSRDPHQPHRAATTLELLFDLVSVIAIAAVTAELHHAISDGHGLEAIPRFLFLFLAIWWAWMNFTWFASAFDNDDAVYRVLVMVIMGGELLFAGGAKFIFASLDFDYGLLGWIVMRVGMVGLWLRAAMADGPYRKTALRYAAGITFAQLCWTGLYFGTEPGSAAFFAVGIACFAVEWAVPLFAESAKETPYHRHHIMERYGLLMIISLGEIVLAISIGFGYLFGDKEYPGAAIVAVSALVIVFSIWWVYFCEEDHLPRRAFRTVFLWGYGHVVIFIAIAMLGAAVAAMVDVTTDHSKVTAADVSNYIGVSMALGSLALWFVRDRELPLPARLYWALPAMAAVFLVAGVIGLPIWGFAILAVVMVAARVPRPAVTEGSRVHQGPH